MKIAVCSDIHLEFGDIDLQNTENAEVLVLSGDIMVAEDLISLEDEQTLISSSRRDRAEEYFKFMKRCSERFKMVLYLAGNHEHYHGDYAETFKILRKTFAEFKNVVVMDKESIVIDDIVFFGGTLWTDMNKEDPITLSHIKGVMNDFRTIRNSTSGPVHYSTPIYAVKEDGSYDYKNVVSKEFHTRPAKFTPEDSVADHKAFLSALKTLADLNPTRKIVVLGHHAPSKMSTHPRYKDETIVNGAYSSDLSEFMLDNRNIKLWTHGHTHEPFDYMIGSCRIVCNPRGYINYEDCADNFELKFVEV